VSGEERETSFLFYHLCGIATLQCSSARHLLVPEHPRLIAVVALILLLSTLGNDKSKGIKIILIVYSLS